MSPLKEHQKKLLKQNSQVGWFYIPNTAFEDKSNGTYPHLYLSCMWRIEQNYFQKYSENRKILCYF